MHIFPRQFLQVVIKDLCMLLFLIGGKFENCFDHMQLLLFRLFCRKSIAISGLAFSFHGFAGLDQKLGHGRQSHIKHENQEGNSKHMNRPNL